MSTQQQSNYRAAQLIAAAYSLQQFRQIFVPGMLIQLGMFGSMFVGFGIIAEIRYGTVERMRVTPASRLGLLLGRVLRDAVVLLQGSSMPVALLANPAFPGKTVADVIALAKKDPGKLNLGSSAVGTGGYMCAEQFKADDHSTFGPEPQNWPWHK